MLTNKINPTKNTYNTHVGSEKSVYILILSAVFYSTDKVKRKTCYLGANAH